METKSEKQTRIATALGLSPALLQTVRLNLVAAESRLSGSKTEKRAMVARRLSITPGELVRLRRALAGDAPEPVPMADRLVAAHVAGLRNLRRTVASSAPPPPKVLEPVRRTPAPRTFSKWSGDTNVFVTRLGDAVHMYSDCHGLRGFRHAHDPDPQVHQVRLRDPVCADRRACRKCFDIWTPATIDRLDELLVNLHGRSVRRPKPKRSPSGKVVVSGGKARATTGKLSKAERDLAEAGRLGITVQQLRTRRRTEQEANRRRKLERRRSD